MDRQYNKIDESSVNVLGVRVHALNIPGILDEIDRFLRAGHKGYITVTGVHGIMESRKSTLVKQSHNGSFLTVPDGMPLVWLGKLKGYKNTDRCYGPDLLLAVLDHSKDKGYKHFFYGGSTGVADTLKVRMEEQFSGVQIVGTYTPPFRSLNQDEENEFIKRISELQPDIVWVGLSTPRQEMFMHEYITRLDTKLMIGVGAAFDFHSGRIKQAPYWIQRSGFEWLYRIFQDPGRL